MVLLNCYEYLSKTKHLSRWFTLPTSYFGEPSVLPCIWGSSPSLTNCVTSCCIEYTLPKPGSNSQLGGDRHWLQIIFKFNYHTITSTTTPVVSEKNKVSSFCSTSGITLLIIVKLWWIVTTVYEGWYHFVTNLISSTYWHSTLLLRYVVFSAHIAGCWFAYWMSFLFRRFCRIYPIPCISLFYIIQLRW